METPSVAQAPRPHHRRAGSTGRRERQRQPLPTIPRAKPELPVPVDVARSLLADLQSGLPSWMPGSRVGAAGRRPLRVSGDPYRGINVLLLWAAAAARGYRSPTWITARQARRLGAEVRSGEHGTTVLYPDGATGRPARPPRQALNSDLLKAYTVYNVEQIVGLPPSLRDPPAPHALEPADIHRRCEAFFEATGALFQHGGEVAHYAPVADVIVMPRRSLYESPQSYAVAKAHALVCWTGHPQRLGRDFRPEYGDDAPWVEELVAEIGAAFLCADLDVRFSSGLQHGDCSASWVRIADRNPCVLLQAAHEAQRALDELDRLVRREALLQALLAE